MYYILFILLLIIITGLFIMLRNQYKLKADFARFRHEISQKQDMAFLINNDLEVKATNYYEKNPDMTDDQPYVLGNVLHCKNGCDSGCCGTGFACQTCPVRYVIKNSFKNKRDFEGVEATMHLYNANNEVSKVDVKVDGELVYANYKPYMIVSVSTT